MKTCLYQGYNDIGVVIVTPVPILFAAVFLGTRNFSSKIVHRIDHVTLETTGPGDENKCNHGIHSFLGVENQGPIDT